MAIRRIAQIDAPYAVCLSKWNPQGDSPRKVSGIDPGKHTLNVCTLHVQDKSVLAVMFNRIDWTTTYGWQEARCLFEPDNNVAYGFGVVEVATETQWADKSILDKWDGVQECVQTTGALRGVAAAVGTGGSRADLFLWAPSAWRKVSLSPRPYSSRTMARASEQACAAALLGGRVQPDMAAALGIALAQADLNYHLFIPL